MLTPPPYGNQLYFRTEEEFNRAWAGEDSSIEKATEGDEWFDEAAAFFARRWLDSDIRLIRTGTIQLFQRRHDTLLEEIAFRSSPSRLGLCTIHVYLSHKALADVRTRYWRLDSRAPQVVAEGNVGLLEEQHAWTMWRFGADVEQMADFVERTALPWFDIFHEPVELHGLLRMNKVPLVGLDTALELVLAEYGRAQASSFLRHMLEMQEDLAREVRQQILSLIRNPGPMGFGENPIQNLAIIAYTYGLLKVRST
jgi:hypothetical protein